MRFDWEGDYAETMAGLSPSAKSVGSMSGSSFTHLTLNEASDADDYVSYPGTAAANLGTGDFTIVWWMKTKHYATETYYRRIYMTDGPTGNKAGNLQLNMDPNTGCFNAWTNSGDLDLVCKENVADDKWHALAFRRKSGALTMWVDGKEGTYSSSHNTRTYTKALGSDNGGKPRPLFGKYTPSGSLGSFRGSIDKFQVYKIALTDSEIGTTAAVGRP